MDLFGPGLFDKLELGKLVSLQVIHKYLFRKLLSRVSLCKKIPPLREKS